MSGEGDVPVLFGVGGFEVTSFGAMMAFAAAVGPWLFRRELRRSRLPDHGLDAAMAGVLGGIVGAKLLWVLASR
jgi:prolipoprotein diacylglyceryltransferase